MSGSTYYPLPEAAGGWRSLVTANSVPTPAQINSVREMAGLDWDRLNDAWAYCDSFGGPNSLLVGRHGWVAGEWHDFTEPQGIASCTKALTGLAMAKVFDLSDAGQLKTPIHAEDEAWRFLPAEWAEMEPARKHILLRHMLTMSSGLTPLDSGFDEHYYALNFDQRVEAPPGTVWAYSSGPVDLLSLVVEAATGQTLADFFHREIGAPIGVGPINWGMFGAHAGGSGGPGGGARFPARELARVGYLVLHDGAWERDGHRAQILSADRLSAMTRRAPFLQDLHWRQPNFAFEPYANRYYGHLWWTNFTGQAMGEAAPRDAIYMSGWGKQACFVVPSLDMVVVRLGRNRTLNEHPEFYHQLWSRLMGAVKE